VVANIRIERPGCHDLDTPTKNFFKIQDKARRKPGTCCRACVNEKINITIRTGLAAYRRTEDTDAECTVLSGNGTDIIAFFTEKLLYVHRQFSYIRVTILGLKQLAIEYEE